MGPDANENIKASKREKMGTKTERNKQYSGIKVTLLKMVAQSEFSADFTSTSSKTKKRK